MSVVAYSIGKAPRCDESQNKQHLRNPGPGNYQPKSLRYQSSPQWGMGSAKRAALLNASAKNNPGPQAYELKSKVGEGPKFVVGQKLGSSLISGGKGPGPGAYSPTKTDVGSSYSMGTKSKFGMSIAVHPEDGTHEKIADLTSTNPGPGTYSAKAVYKNVNSGPRFGNEERQSMANTATKWCPGPNAYKADNKNPVLRKAPTFGFGTSKRPQSHNAKRVVPGPGHYPIGTLIGTESQGKSLAERLPRNRTSNEFSPGPGAYTSQFSQSMKAAPRFGIGTSQRYDTTKTGTRNFPPPDTYNPNYSSSKMKATSWSFGSSKREPLARNSKTPGAGTYQTPNRAVEGPQFNMGLKLDNQSSIGQALRKSHGKPGPGKHDPDYKVAKKAMPAFSMISRPPGQKKMNVPGPGTYESASPDKQRAPTFAFGTSAQREPTKETLSPGPGGYSVPSQVANLPQYTGARSKDYAYV